MKLVNLLPDHYWEREYLSRVCEHLRPLLPVPDLVLVITNNGETIPTAGGRCVVIQTSDELHGVPRYNADVLMVFKQYVPRLGRPNVRPIPLGYAGGLPSRPPAPARSRAYDFSFAGYLHRARAQFKEEIERIEAAGRYRSFVSFNDDWRTGLGTEQYADLLYDTKIALCPSGIHSPESFRVFEALKAGCVVVTTVKPKTWFYEGWPAVEVGHWSEARHRIDEMLDDPRLLTELQERHLRWWAEKCAEEKVAEYIAGELSAYLASEGETVRRI